MKLRKNFGGWLQLLQHLATHWQKYISLNGPCFVKRKSNSSRIIVQLSNHLDSHTSLIERFSTFHALGQSTHIPSQVNTFVFIGDDGYISTQAIWQSNFMLYLWCFSTTSRPRQGTERVAQEHKHHSEASERGQYCYSSIWAHHSHHPDQCFRAHQTLISVATCPKQVNLLNSSFPDSFMARRHPEMTSRGTNAGRPMQGCAIEQLSPCQGALQSTQTLFDLHLDPL